jgi:alpha-amylase/alpha-mannosidase (GH57 family)
LYLLRSTWAGNAEQALARFRPRDLRDLQVWSNLAWIHPLLFEKDPELAEFKSKGRYYTEEEKQWFLDKQRDLLAQVIPRHRALAERGQIELTTSPYYHPILPLLLDKKLAREAMPDVVLPAYKEGYPDDAEIHVRRAVDSHIKRFGSAPRGMWPSEGSVCQALIPLLARNGVEWIATDEEILGCSTGGKVGRDSRGFVRHPELLYRAWKVHEGNHELSIVFRDHSMSDQVGFHYQRSPGHVAAADFLGKLHAIGEACRHNPAPLVSVILDGENCWEYYPDGGVSFLRSLYQGAVRDSRIKPVRAGEFVRQHPTADPLHRLFAGSWISHNFAIWIGHQEDNRGWDALHATRQFLLAEERTGRPDQASLARAWEEVFIAEGSDWFWWFGDDHSSAQDSLFDHLFRKHLRNVYTLLGCDPPGILFTPISQAGSHRPINDQPMSFLNVKIDGHATYFEWIDGVRYFCGNERGTMAIVTKGLIQCLWFGFDAERFLLRLDIEGGPASERLAEVDRLRVGFIDPVDREVVAVQPSTRQPVAYLNHAGRTLANGSTIAVATGEILEMAVPFARLERMPGDPIRFYVELLKGESSVDRAPREGIFELTAPCPDFERIMWQV